MATSRALNVLLLGLCLTAACVPLVLADISYQGEITDITSYKGPNYSDTLWDYVYNIDSQDSWQWGVQVLVPITDIYSPSGWAGAYYASVPSTFTGLEELWGKPAVVWYRKMEGTPGYTGFHFRTGGPPAILAYDSYPTSWKGQTWSAGVPEPGSVFLASMLLASAGIWRRWRKHGKSAKF